MIKKRVYLPKKVGLRLKGYEAVWIRVELWTKIRKMQTTREQGRLWEYYLIVSFLWPTWWQVQSPWSPQPPPSQPGLSCFVGVFWPPSFPGPQPAPSPGRSAAATPYRPWPVSTGWTQVSLGQVVQTPCLTMPGPTSEKTCGHESKLPSRDIILISSTNYKPQAAFTNSSWMFYFPIINHQANCCPSSPTQIGL